ncbi:hypothetical protein BDW22DRAFT_2861 [Trametopsis cervina]|nr:hypothetical protein BDW22DRAFT_2861 [Trametopsis cervina]
MVSDFGVHTSNTLYQRVHLQRGRDVRSVLHELILNAEHLMYSTGRHSEAGTAAHLKGQTRGTTDTSSPAEPVCLTRFTHPSVMIYYFIYLAPVVWCNAWPVSLSWDAKSRTSLVANIESLQNKSPRSSCSILAQNLRGFQYVPIVA